MRKYSMNYIHMVLSIVIAAGEKSTKTNYPYIHLQRPLNSITGLVQNCDHVLPRFLLCYIANFG